MSRDSSEKRDSRELLVPEQHASAETPEVAHPLASGVIQRKVARRALSRRTTADARTHENADQAVEKATQSNGASLPAEVQHKFEGSLGADLSGVRVHTGGDSVAAAESVSAKAYTVGQDIHFNAEQYEPSSKEGQHLLAHEVAHTVQQSGGAARKMQHALEVSTPADSEELEADRAADAMVAGQFAPLASGGDTRLARAADPERQAQHDRETTASAERTAQARKGHSGSYHDLTVTLYPSGLSFDEQSKGEYQADAEGEILKQTGNDRAARNNAVPGRKDISIPVSGFGEIPGRMLLFLKECGKEGGYSIKRLRVATGHGVFRNVGQYSQAQQKDLKSLGYGEKIPAIQFGPREFFDPLDLKLIKEGNVFGINWARGAEIELLACDIGLSEPFIRELQRVLSGGRAKIIVAKVHNSGVAGVNADPDDHDPKDVTRLPATH